MVLKQVIEENETRGGRIFDLAIQALIIVSLIAFTVETLPDLPRGFRKFLRGFEIVSVLIFTLEYLLRLWVADHKPKFIFSFFGLVDLLAILPFYLAVGIDLRSVRVLRLFRLLRMLKLLRYSEAASRIRYAIVTVKEELILFSVATVFLLYLSAVGIYYFENAAQPEAFKSIFHSLWWAVATLTTVGYGDIYPVTAGGRAFTFIILMIGLGIFAVPTGLLASALSDSVSRKKDEESD